MKKSLLTVIGMCLLLLSCQKDIDNAQKISDGEVVIDGLEPSFVVPLINSRATLAEIEEELEEPLAELEEEGFFLEVDNTGLYSIRFDSTASSDQLNDYYEIPDITESFSLNVPPENLLVPVGASITWDTTFNIAINPPFNARLETVEISAGDINIILSHDINQQITGNIRINSLSDLRTGEVYDEDFLTNPATVNSSFDNHIIDVMDNAGNRNVIEVTVSITGTAISPVLTGNSVNVDLFFGNFFLEYIDGLVTQVPIEIPASQLDFDFLDEVGIEELRVANPIIEIEVLSTLGMPTTLDFNTLEFGYPDGSTQDLEPMFNFVAQGVQNRSDIPDNPTRSQSSVDRDNSRIDELITTAPNSLVYDLDVRAGNGAVEDFFFLTSESQIRADFSVILPFDFQVLDYTFEDTVDIDMIDLDSTIIDSYERGAVKLIFENGLPFEAEVQAFFIDENGVVLDSVFRDGPELVLANDNLDSEGIITSIDEVTSFVELDREGFLNLLSAESIGYRIVASTAMANPDLLGMPRFVKLLSSYSFGLRAGLEADFNIDLNDIIEE